MLRFSNTSKHTTYTYPNTKEAVLLVAVERGLDNFVDHLIQIGTDVNANSPGKTPLVTAVSNGHVKIAEALIAAGADVNVAQSSRRGVTALTEAARKEYNNIIRYLVRLKADVNISENDGTTALMLAASYGDDESVELLLEAGADVNRCE